MYKEMMVSENNELKDVIEELLEYCDVKDEDGELGRTNFSDPVSEDEILEFSKYLPTAKKGVMLVDALVDNGLAESKKKAREFLAQGAITINGEKINEDLEVNQVAIVKKGKNKFLIVK